MRIPTHKDSGRRPVNLTPMIDVVFQLIVFFTATSTIAKSEFSQTVELPVAEKGREREEANQKRKITANVLATGELFVSGRSVSAAEFREMLDAELAEHSPDRLEVQFRADRAATYGAVEPLLLTCARAGVWQVSFAVKPLREP